MLVEQLASFGTLGGVKRCVMGTLRLLSIGFGLIKISTDILDANMRPFYQRFGMRTAD